MRKRHSAEQIAAALRQAEAGTPVAEIIRKLSIHENTFYTLTRNRGLALRGPDVLRALCSIPPRNRGDRRQSHPKRGPPPQPGWPEQMLTQPSETRPAHEDSANLARISGRVFRDLVASRNYPDI
jgi:hypothetical protein